MTSNQEHHLISSYKSFATYSSAFVITVGLLVICGWIFNIPILKSVSPDLAAMKPNTAFGFILSGIALWLSNDETVRQKKIWTARICSALTILLGLLTLGEYMFDKDLGIDQLLFSDIETSALAYPGRMALTTTINFILGGLPCGLLVQRLGGWDVSASRLH